MDAAQSDDCLLAVFKHFTVSECLRFEIVSSRWKNNIFINQRELDTDEIKVRELAVEDKPSGIPWPMRKLAKSASSTKTFKANDNGTYEVENKTTLKTLTWTFTLGTPFETEGFDGKKQRITITVNNGKLLEHHVLLDQNNEEEPVEYHFDGGYLVQVMKSGTVECKRYFKKK